MDDFGSGLKATLTHRFLETCDKLGNNTAIIDDTGSLTYAELGAAAKKMAALLTELTPQQNIGILLPTCKEFSIAYFATLLMGKTPVPLNFLMSPAQLSYVMKDASLDTVITISPFRNLVEGQINHCVCLDEIKAPIRKSQASARTNKFVHATQLSRLVGSPEDTAVLLYTSGTTANPKGIILTHKNILSVIDGVAPSFKFTHEDVIIGVLPLFHSFALTVTLALPVCFGAKVVYITRFSGPRVFELIEKHKITIVAAIPSMFRVMLRTLESSKYDLSSVRLYATGGEPLPRDIIEDFSAVSLIPLFEGYGLTEASAIVSVNLPDKYSENDLKDFCRNKLPHYKIPRYFEFRENLPKGTTGKILKRALCVWGGSNP